MNYKINLLESVLSVGDYHLFESESKRNVHFPFTEIFYSLLKKFILL